MLALSSCDRTSGSAESSPPTAVTNIPLADEKSNKRAGNSAPAAAPQSLAITLRLGPIEHLASFTLGPGKTSHTITGTGTALDGAVIAATNASTYPGMKTFDIEYRIILTKSLDEILIPRSPLVTLSFHGWTPPEGVIVTFPIVTKDAGSMGGVAYDSAHQTITRLLSQMTQGQVFILVPDFASANGSARRASSFFVLEGPSIPPGATQQ